MLLLVSSLASLIFVCLTAPELKPDVPTVTVMEGSDAVLTCSPNPLKNLHKEVFDWNWRMNETADHKKEVFMYRDGDYDGNTLDGQDQQFKGRVSHFPDQLINGNASILIRNTQIEDTGLYTCIFPFLQDQRVSMRLVVGVAHKPYVSICGVLDSGVRLKCEVEGASPKPELQWLDSDGVVLPAEHPEVSQTGRLFDVTLQTTVNSTNTFYCVVKQENFLHQIKRNITVPEKMFQKTSREVEPGSCSSGTILGIFFIGALIGAFLLAVGQALLVATNRMTVSFNKGRHQPAESPSAQPLNGKQNGQTGP
ncbi:butyrophilin-like protein 1 isoform X2 [Acanthochromis polyacanthus]|uniref:butyrophilin-like protein 1 isoform X2 n=1 Tax=Acanthochromis polyacanthus TaxID=80966 RepID=UPI0022340BD9|nr:butyrophilin-like protein 1 isoform X2 [Acanthochromis polyacanthus]